MKLIKKIIDGIEVYFENGIEKYEHCEDSDGNGWWREYNNKGNEIHYKTSSGYEMWKKYDSRGNIIYSKDSSGNEWREKDISDVVEVKEEVEVNIEPFIFKNK